MRFAIIVCILSSTLGASSQEYFQQQVDYIIHVKLDDNKHLIRGNEQFVYTNNSPDELSFIHMHLWPNAYASAHTALANQITEDGNLNLYFSTDDDKGFIDSLNFTSEGNKLQWELDAKNKDIAKITLSKPLKSGESISIKTPFRVKIPNSSISRLGHVGQSYQITQWYPKPAVYDHNGWHPMPYLSQGEFYSEYGTFDVHITLAKNYVVGATGDLVNGEKELAWLNELNKKTIAKLEEETTKNLDFPESSKETKTLHYHQEKVHDFAWFADKRFNVLKGSVELPHSKKTVDTWLMFTDAEAKLWKNALPYINDAVYYYSLWLGDYPYNHATAVDGTISAGAGMEYPNITIIGTSGTPKSLETVIVHEVGHNWFYGILGSNERKNAWMDEGLNSLYESRYLETKYPNEKLLGNLPIGLQKYAGLDLYSQRYMHDLSYLLGASYNLDQPIQLSSEKYSAFNYGGIVYSKTAVMFDYLKTYLGDAEFDKIMMLYYEQWKFKHPEPKDLEKIFTDNSTKDLSWFFIDILKTTHKIDYKITGRKKTNNAYVVSVKSNTKLNAPVSVYAIKNDSVYQTIWTTGKKKETVIFSNNTKPDYFKINYDLKIPEINNRNNYLRNSGVLRKVEPLRFQFLAGLDNPNKTVVYYSSILGWNNYDKFMAGIAFYNHTLYQRPFEYTLIPMYGFGSKKLVGMGNMAAHLKPENTFQSISLGVNSKRFSFYNESDALRDYLKASPFVEFVLKPTYPRKRIKTALKLNYDFIQNKLEDETSRLFENINQLSSTFSMISRQILKPKSIEINYSIGDIINSQTATFSHISFTGKLRHNYTKELDGMTLRMFAGKYLSTAPDGRFRFYAGGQTGASDYAYNSTYFGRTEPYNNLLAQQMIFNQGGVRALVPSFYSSNDWLLAFNFDFELPSMIKIPFNFYADLAFLPQSTYNVNTNTVSTKTESLFAAGFSLPLFGKTVEIFIPVIYSSNIKDVYTYSDIQFLQRIRININLDKLNPFKIIERNIL